MGKLQKHDQNVANEDDTLSVKEDPTVDIYETDIGSRILAKVIAK